MTGVVGAVEYKGGWMVIRVIGGEGSYRCAAIAAGSHAFTNPLGPSVSVWPPAGVCVVITEWNADAGRLVRACRLKPATVKDVLVARKKGRTA